MSFPTQFPTFSVERSVAFLLLFGFSFSSRLSNRVRMRGEILRGLQIDSQTFLSRKSTAKLFFHSSQKCNPTECNAVERRWWCEILIKRPHNAFPSRGNWHNFRFPPFSWWVIHPLPSPFVSFHFNSRETGWGEGAKTFLVVEQIQ